MTLIFIRLIVIILALVVWSWTQKLIGAQPPAPAGIGDRVPRATAHRYAPWVNGWLG